MQWATRLEVWWKKKDERPARQPSDLSRQTATSTQPGPMDLTEDMRSEMLEEWRAEMTGSMSDDELIWHADRLPPSYAQDCFHRVILEETRRRDLLDGQGPSPADIG